MEINTKLKDLIFFFQKRILFLKTNKIALISHIILGT